MNIDYTAIGVAAIGVGLPALLSLNIFATKADLATMKQERAELYVSKQELKETIHEIKADIKELKALAIKNLK